MSSKYPARVADLTGTDVVAALHRFGLARDRLRTALARRLRLSVADLDALEHLELDGPLSQRDLAERLHFTSGAITMLVDRLERAGLAVRQPHPTDRRICLIELAPQPSLPEVPELDSYHAAIRAAADALSPLARDHAHRYLTQAAQAAATATAQLRSTAGAPGRE